MKTTNPITTFAACAACFLAACGSGNEAASRTTDATDATSPPVATTTHATGLASVPPPTNAALSDDAYLVDIDDRPISVADAYHGVGVTFCLGDRRVVTVADAYHGIGFAVCVPNEPQAEASAP